ncbi:MAG: branched-chain amino acid transport system II carrier protein [Ruminiclostridium sp.]|nr:branched-chain amino acid transport system II carrier protein [Ruminiclostridium sp.]
MGQLAGSNLWPAVLGFIITGVGLPLLGVAALGISRQDSLFDLSCCVGKKYGYFFTCALYLTIGPFFAIPRCATVSYTVGAVPLLENGDSPLILGIFSLVFFALTLALSFRPSKILTWVGKVLTPVFLCFLGVLVIRALISPMGTIQEITPDPSYADRAFFTGFQQGYQTMDALASLAFGIVVVNVIRELGVTKPDAVAKNTVFSGIFSCLIMAAIYLMVTIVGTQSRGLLPVCENGGEALALIANLGLNAIIEYAVPVLMLLYPLAITLILLALFGKFFDHDRRVYAWVTGCTLIPAVLDFLNALPAGVFDALNLAPLMTAAGQYLPFFSLGFGWIVPACIGLVVGLVLRKAKP